jgi:hypothetical protein
LQERIYNIRNRRIDSSDIDTIRQFIETHFEKGRTVISKLLCEHWNWRQPNGILKDRACRELLLKLEKIGEIQLPPLLVNRRPRGKNKAPTRAPFAYDRSPVYGPISGSQNLKLKMVRRSTHEKMWDYLINTYHYLGNPSIVGAYLKYIAYLDERPVACLGWGGAAWKVACRDTIIGWDTNTRKQHLHMVVNNVRFLILPWIRVKNLASRLLSANIRVLAKDWYQFYAHPVVLAETFVDGRFAGTCYKAANWMYAGDTKGRGKYDRYNQCPGSVKAVFLYPLQKNFQEVLRW